MSSSPQSTTSLNGVLAGLNDAVEAPLKRKLGSQPASFVGMDTLETVDDVTETDVDEADAEEPLPPDEELELLVITLADNDVEVEELELRVALVEDVVDAEEELEIVVEPEFVV